MFASGNAANLRARKLLVCAFAYSRASGALGVSGPRVSRTNTKTSAQLAGAMASGHPSSLVMLLAPCIEPSHLFVVIKGHVTQFDGDEPVTTFGPSDCFDGRALVAGRVSGRFIAAEEVVAYELAKAAVNEFISRNATFGALPFAGLSIKLGALAQRHIQREMQALTTSRVAETFLRPAQVVDGGTDIVGVATLMQAHHSSSVLVRNGERLGTFTNHGLHRAIVAYGYSVVGSLGISHAVRCSASSRRRPAAAIGRQRQLDQA